MENGEKDTKSCLGHRAEHLILSIAFSARTIFVLYLIGWDKANIFEAWKAVLQSKGIM